MLNPKWIDGMQKHGYKGAFELSASLDYLFAYDAATNRVPSWCYSAICQKWIQETTIKDFLKENNPWVLKDICEKLLEAHNRQMWKTVSEHQLETLKDTVNKMDEIIEKR